MTDGDNEVAVFRFEVIDFMPDRRIEVFALQEFQSRNGHRRSARRGFRRCNADDADFMVTFADNR